MVSGTQWARGFWRQRGPRTRLGLIAVGVIFAVVAAALLTSPLWLTPLLQSERATIERSLTAAAGTPVHIGALFARIGWRPSVGAHAVVVQGARRPAVILKTVHVQLSWLALLHGRVWPAFLGVAGARLDLRRTAQGWHVVGLPRHQGSPLHWRALLRRTHSLKLVQGRIGVALSPHRNLVLRQLKASWARGFREPEVKASAAIPGVCESCALTVEFENAALHLKRFGGAVGVAARGLNLKAAAHLIHTAALAPLKGQASGRLWTTWRQGRLGFVGGQAALVHAFLPATRHNRALALGGLGARFSLKMSQGGFRFYATDLKVDAGGVSTRTRSFSAARQQGVWHVTAGRLSLEQLSFLARHIRPLPTGVASVVALAPEGDLRRLHLTWAPGSPAHYRVRVRFLKLGLKGGAQGPSFAHARGTLQASTTKGRLVVTGLHGLVRGGKVVPGPLRVRTFHTEILWQRSPGAVAFQVPVLHLASTVGTVDVTASGTRLAGQSPHVMLNVALRDVSAGALSGLYPRSLKAHLRQWLTRTIRGGLITRGHVLLAGPLNQFPYRKGGGVFHVVLHVVGGRYRFLPRWPTAHDLNVQVIQNDAQVDLTGSGRLGGVAAPQILVHAGPLGTPQGEASVQFQGQGDLKNLLALVLPHVHHGLRRFVPKTVAGHGPVQVALALQIPFSHKKHGTPLSWQGHVKLSGVDLRYPFQSRVLAFQGLHGLVGFSEKGPQSGHLIGRLLGGPFALHMAPRPNGLVAQAQGTFSASGLQQVLGPAAPYVKGAAPWRLHLIKGARLRMSAEVNLHEAAVDLPYPAGKAAGIPGVMSFHWLADQKGLVAGASLPRHLSLSYAALKGRPGGLWVGIGSALPPHVLGPGLALAVRSSYLDAGAWMRFVKRLPTQVAQGASSHVKAFPLRSVRAYVGSLALGGRSFGLVRAHFLHVGPAWQGLIRGPDIDGTVDWRPHPRPSLVVRLTRLIVPKTTSRPQGRAASSPMDPHHLPAIRLIANDLTVDGYHVGHVAIDGAPFPDGFRFGRIWLSHRRTAVTGHGQWTSRGGRAESLFTLVLHAHNLGHSLSSWGLPHQLAGGRAVAHGTLNWPGSPMDFSLAQLEAHLQFFVRHGRFLKVNEGAGKLLGIFNVDSIARYLTLDFSNIFGRGFSFNHIDGKLLVEQGSASTPKITIDGTSARVVVSGTTGLVAKTFNLKVQVNPHLQNNLTLASGLLGGPIAGAAVLLMQKIFASEINQGTRLTYYIKGPWSKPTVRKKADKD